jgi:hypothetical protein
MIHGLENVKFKVRIFPLNGNEKLTQIFVANGRRSIA